MTARPGFYANPPKIIGIATGPARENATEPRVSARTLPMDPDARHLRTLLTIVGLVSLGVAAPLIFVWSNQHQLHQMVGALGLGTLGIGVLIGCRYVTRATVGRAAVVACSALLVVVVAIALAGNGTSTLALTSLVALLIAVPYVNRQALRWVAVAAWLAALVVGLSFAMASPTGLSSPDALVRFLGVGLNTTIAIFVIFHLSGRLNAGADRYRDLFQRVPVGMYRTTPDGRFLDANGAFAQMFGIDRPDDLMSIAAADLYADPSDRGRFKETMEAVGVAHSVEFRARRQDGRVFWVRDSAKFVRDAAGRPLYYEGIVEDVTERKQHELRLEQRASVDRLTGLANRAVLTDLLDDALATPARKVALLFVDLDDFKQVNDRFGHATGDELLVEAGRRLTMATRKRDIVCRFGGDEFAVLLDVPTGRVVASTVAKRIVDAFRQPFLVGGEEVTLGASVGVAIGDPSMSSAELIHRADSAMYEAKSETKVPVLSN
jgi:diguanylate cyclase (GGDEF)-like protein/PAS domain S-box-containing protein